METATESVRNKEKVIDIIQKLLRLGDPTRNNSEGEVFNATAKAQELLRKYNIDLADVIIKEGEKIVDLEIGNEIVFTKKKSSMSSWEKWLISVVSSATECKGYFNKKCVNYYTRSIVYEVGFIGTEWDRAIAKELYCYLHSTIHRLGRQNYPESSPQIRCYMEGFCSRLSERVNEQMKVKVENQKYELMVINKKDAINLYGKDQMHLKHSKGRAGGGDWDGGAYAHGREDANKIDLGTKARLGENGSVNINHTY
jgi:hypothetical protein